MVQQIHGPKSRDRNRHGAGDARDGQRCHKERSMRTLGEILIQLQKEQEDKRDEHFHDKKLPAKDFEALNEFYEDRIWALETCLAEYFDDDLARTRSVPTEEEYRQDRKTEDQLDARKDGH
jgi:hypothetical protein